MHKMLSIFQIWAINSQYINDNGYQKARYSMMYSYVLNDRNI